MTKDQQERKALLIAKMTELDQKKVQYSYLSEMGINHWMVRHGFTTKRTLNRRNVNTTFYIPQEELVGQVTPKKFQRISFRGKSTDEGILDTTIRAALYGLEEKERVENVSSNR